MTIGASGPDSGFPAIRVHVDCESLSFNGHSIVGLIHLRADDVLFPEADWSDFPVVILSWWMRELDADAMIGRRCIRCHFMDGPLYFDVLPHPDRWEIRWAERGGSIQTWQLSDQGAIFVGSLRDAAERVVAMCREKGWQTADVERLAAML